MKRIGIILLFLILLWVALLGRKHDAYPELSELAAKSWAYEELETYFRRLAREKGAVYAFNILDATPLTAFMNSHGIAHIIGDELVKQKGIEAVIYCTPHFRNACAHSVVGRLLLEKGETALVSAAMYCKKTKGGKEGQALCMHGIGHGLLTSLNYDMDRAMTLCKSLPPEDFDGREIGECIGALVMELTVGGEHDKVNQQRQYRAYFEGKNALFPCNDAVVPTESKPSCYEYITFRLYDVVGANPRGADPVFNKQAMSYCDRIPAREPESVARCFGGFGRQFVQAQQDMEIRIPSRDTLLAKSETLYRWCNDAPTEMGAASCVGDAVRALYWSGTVVDEAAGDLCGMVAKGDSQRTCMDQMVTSAFLFHPSDTYRKSLCESLPAPYTDDCQKKRKSDTIHSL